MKRITIVTLISFCFLFFSQDAQNQNSPKNSAIPTHSSVTNLAEAEYLEGVVTIKLKEGVGNYSKQTEAISLGIASLDEKMNRFEVYELDKRFRFNPAKRKAGMPDLSRIYKIRFPEDISYQQVLNEFKMDPNVEYAEPIPIHHLDITPNDDMYDYCQHLPQIMAEEAWEIHKGEDGTEEVIIAIVDTGIEWDHEDLRENAWQNLGEDADGDGQTMEFIAGEWVLDPDDLNNVDDDGNGFTDDLLGWNFILNEGDPTPIVGNPVGYHGTHCAGISNGRTNNESGIASISWNISVMGICSDQNNTLQYGYDGIIYAAENGADIISNSWGSSNPSQANQEVIDYVTQLGSIVLAAAGNFNTTDQHYPASYVSALSVASVSVNDSKAAYSAFGPAVDIAAPGGGTEGGILSTLLNNTYGNLSGTSMATPLAAGCLGLLKSYNPDWSNEELIVQVLGSADNIDDMNPDFIDLLGSGRVNAFSMLDEDNVSLPEVLKIDLMSSSFIDDNGNMVIEAGETAYLNASFRNYVAFVGDENATATLSTDNPDITILEGTASIEIPPDGYFSIEDQFLFQVSDGASSQLAEFTLTFESELNISWGLEHTVHLLIAPSGVFIFEGTQNQTDFSGTLIKDVLDQLGIHNIYSNTYPSSLLGFDHVFISHGNPGEILGDGAPFTEQMSLMFQEFMESGGNLYLEIGAMVNAMAYYGFSNAADLMELLGIQSNTLHMSENPINLLSGMEGSPMEGIHFTESTQTYNWYIDELTISEDAIGTFSESNYGTVSVMYDGEESFGHKSFYMGYTLAALLDIDPENSRNNALLKVLDFFEMLDDGYMLPGFDADKYSGGAPLEVQFTDFSLSDPAYPIQSWKWDLDGDGFIDSEDQNPSWMFTNPSNYDITLITTNEMGSDTLTRENFITINHGHLVYEGKENGEGYSGTFIRDYMEESGFYGVTYTNELPNDLSGYQAVFLSFGNYDSDHTELTDEMASIIIEYINNGGFVYLEGGDSFGWDQASNIALHNAFGLASAADGSYNAIDHLAGQEGSITEGQLFLSTSQQAVTFIDLYTPLDGETAAFIESDYGAVSVQYTGENNQRTFCFSYTLADLDDGEYPNTRQELLNRICGFFDIYTGEEELTVSASGNQVQAYPNPTSGQVSILLSLGKACHVSMKVYDLMGNTVGELPGRFIAAGNQKLMWNFENLEEGIYFCKLSMGEEVRTLRVVKVK